MNDRQPLYDAIKSFISAARPAVALDPVIYDLDAKEAELYRLANLSSLSSANFFFWPAIAGAAQAVNKLFGSNIVVPNAPPPPPSTVFHELTPEQLAATPEPIPDPPLEPVQEVKLLPETDAAEAPAPASSSQQPTSIEGSAAQTVAPTVGTFYETTVDAKPGLAAPALKSVNPTTTMALNNIDPTYASAYSTTLPGTPSMSSFDLGGALLGAAQTLLGGGNAGDALAAGLQGSGLLPSGPSTAGATPGIAGADDPQLLNQLLNILKGIPGGQVPAGVIQGAQNLIGNGTKSNVPAAGGFGDLPVNGMPPMVQAEQAVVYRSPPGYVTVTIRGSNGMPVKVSMLKPLARYYKLWKPRPKPPIKASEWKALKTAERVSKKAKTIATKAGYSCRLK